LALGITKFPNKWKQEKCILREEYERIIQEWGREYTYVENKLYSSFHGGRKNLSRKLENLAENDVAFK
jgi:hypothetical protein